MIDRPFLFFFLTLPTLLFSQNVERLEKQADDLFEKGEYSSALTMYGALEKYKPGVGKILAHIGICHFENNDLPAAEGYLTRSLNATEGAPPVAYQYLGKLYHAHLDFEKAILYYKLFLRHSTGNDRYRAAVKDDLLRCAHGKMVRRQTPFGSIVHLAKPVNTEVDESNPFFSPNRPNVLYFASDRRQNPDGAFSLDIFSTERETGTWAHPLSIGLTVNTPAHEMPLGFSPSGGLFYFFRGNTSFSGDILVDTLRENAAEKNVFHAEFISPIRSWESDCDPHFHNDTTLLFASRRPGGFGGLDIYITTFNAQNGWAPPANLGPTINSAYDDRSPFLAADGHTLYFSTNDARRSIGGSDILKSVFLDRVQKWTPPENLGIPFNSAADDEGFSLSGNGRSALFVSSRKTGFGKRDLYMGIFPENNNTQLPPPNTSIFQIAGKDKHRIARETPSAPSGNETTGFAIHPIQHGGPLLPMPEKALPKWEELAVLLKTYPHLKILLVGYAATGEDGPQAVSIVLEKATSSLLERGVGKQQVKWLAAPAKFSPQKDGPRALDIFAANPEILPPPVKIIQATGGSFEAAFFQKSLNSLVYQVQVPINENTRIEELVKFYPDGLLSQHAESAQLWFAPGYHLSWAAATEAEKATRQIGFADAEVVPLLNGWELGKRAAAQHLHEYPELEYYIGRE